MRPLLPFISKPSSQFTYFTVSSPVSISYFQPALTCPYLSSWPQSTICLDYFNNLIRITHTHINIDVTSCILTLLHLLAPSCLPSSPHLSSSCLPFFSLNLHPLGSFLPFILHSQVSFLPLLTSSPFFLSLHPQVSLLPLISKSFVLPSFTSHVILRLYFISTVPSYLSFPYKHYVPHFSP